MTNNSVFVSCMPTDLKSKRFQSLGFADFDKISYHFKVKNNGPDTVQLNLYGSWWLETYESVGISPVTYIQDNKCPYKLAEYVLGTLRNTKMCVLESNADTEYSNIDATITAAIATITNPWQIITNNVVFETTVAPEPEPEPEPDSDEEWGARPMIWNP